MQTIRIADQGDIAELTRLRWDFREEEQSLESMAEFGTHCNTWLHDALISGRWTIVVAGSETRSLYGCMFLQHIEKVPTPGCRNRAWGYLTNSYVSPERRGSGIGRELLDHVIEVAADLELELLIVWPSPESTSLYLRAGFQEVSDLHTGLGDHPPLELVL